MPIPTPHKGENREKFVNRCMGDGVMNKEYPDQKQRVAICMSKATEGMSLLEATSFQVAYAASASIDNLPDSDFAYISPGGTKDSSGKTTPRSLRHLPIHDAAHVRDALARLNQTDIPAAAKKEALAKIKRKAHEFGIQVSE